jgi:hypothetical protein
MATREARRSPFGTTVAIRSADERELDRPDFGSLGGVALEVRELDVRVDMITARKNHRDDVVERGRLWMWGDLVSPYGLPAELAHPAISHVDLDGIDGLVPAAIQFGPLSVRVMPSAGGALPKPARTLLTLRVAISLKGITRYVGLAALTQTACSRTLVPASNGPLPGPAVLANALRRAFLRAGRAAFRIINDPKADSALTDGANLTETWTRLAARNPR